MIQVTTLRQIQWAVGMGLLCAAASLSAQTAPLTAGDPVALGNTKGKFDFIRIDSAQHRLLLAHTGNKTLDVFDVESKMLLKSVPTGQPQDAAVDTKNGRYYVSVSQPPKMAIVDSAKLEVTGEVPLPAATDLMTINPATGTPYVCNDTAPELWVIDPEARKIAATITLSGEGMEDLAFGPDNKQLFQVVKGGNTLSVIDPSSNKVQNTYGTAPATNPHGMAIVPDAGTVLVAGGSGKLALINRTNGKVVASAEIPAKVDEMAYDAQTHTAYCPGQGKIAVFRVEAEKLTPIGMVACDPAARSIVVDPKTHVVWMAFSKGDKSFVQPFTPAK